MIAGLAAGPFAAARFGPRDAGLVWALAWAARSIVAAWLAPALAEGNGAEFVRAAVAWGGLAAAWVGAVAAADEAAAVAGGASWLAASAAEERVAEPALAPGGAGFAAGAAFAAGAGVGVASIVAPCDAAAVAVLAMLSVSAVAAARTMRGFRPDAMSLALLISCGVDADEGVARGVGGGLGGGGLGGGWAMTVGGALAAAGALVAGERAILAP